jgi:hypothetical protein
VHTVNDFPVLTTVVLSSTHSSGTSLTRELADEKWVYGVADVTEDDYLYRSFPADIDLIDSRFTDAEERAYFYTQLRRKAQLFIFQLGAQLRSLFSAAPKLVHLTLLGDSSTRHSLIPLFLACHPSRWRNLLSLRIIGGFDGSFMSCAFLMDDHEIISFPRLIYYEDYHCSELDVVLTMCPALEGLCCSSADIGSREYDYYLEPIHEEAIPKIGSCVSTRLRFLWYAFQEADASFPNTLARQCPNLEILGLELEPNRHRDDEHKTPEFSPAATKIWPRLRALYTDSLNLCVWAEAAQVPISQSIKAIDRSKGADAFNRAVYHVLWQAKNRLSNSFASSRGL